MLIQELLRLALWFDQHIVMEKIPDYYQALFNKMNTNVQPNHPKQPFEDSKEQLFKALSDININSLTLEQMEFLKSLEVLDLIGEAGVRNIKSILYENNLDIAAATIKVGNFNDRVKEAQTTLDEIYVTLNKSFSTDEEIEGISDDSIIMRVYFQEGSSINDLSDFKKLGSTWYDIGRGIAMAQNKSPEDFNIIGAQKGSIIIDMAIYAGLATSVTTILLAGLKVAERVIEILKKAEELKILKLKNKKIEQEIKKEAADERKNGIKTILETAVKQLKLKPNSDGDKITALEKSITKLIDFTQKGGAVDFIQPEDTAVDDSENKDNDNLRNEITKLRENVQEIRSLELKIKLIEATTGTN